MKPTLRQCIDRFCLNCKSNDVYAVGNCAKEECALWSVRPNQSLLGQSDEDDDPEETKQEILDALEFHGLTEKYRDYL